MPKTPNELHFRFAGFEIAARGTTAVVIAAIIAMSIIVIWGIIRPIA